MNRNNIPPLGPLALLRYFARFVSDDAIRKLCTNNTSIPIIEELLAIPKEEPLIGDLVLGENLEGVKQRIASVEKDFLFIDYGEIVIEQDSSGRMAERSRTAITVAERLTRFNSEMLIHSLAIDRCLSHCVTIRRAMARDREMLPKRVLFSPDVTLMPFSSPELRSVGCTLLFDRLGYNTMK
ncbi:MAG: hypothetical protein SPI35_05880 [Porphyromonas sp.]|nr:hypothetical protein [Porphyromonas sp.]